MPKKPIAAADTVSLANDEAANPAAVLPTGDLPPLPATGGVYLRQPDGGLQAVDGPAAQATQE